ncbi:hypothetical protein WMY93_007088 [Mugilogobius chulae]|uniref:PB1 domain-containing protein n=1 Tax=Mugilogobius chulae TaxID=88201 RepID=A0AAW0Q1S2_9GOBI
MESVEEDLADPHIQHPHKLFRYMAETHEVSDGEFTLRTKSSHDIDVQAVTQGQCQQQHGVQQDCVLNHLEYFHTVTGFPPDVLHDLLEGVVPVELALCLDVAMKLTLTQRPHSVDELKTIMQQKFRPRLDGEFTLQYEDPDFDGMLSCLMDIDELPEKGTLRVVRSESDESSLASSDTDILPHVPLHQRQKHWPSTFTVPCFLWMLSMCSKKEIGFIKILANH